jgi:type I restriction enzyme R subunit
MSPEEFEWQTRRDRINKKLESLPQPWKVVKYHPSLNLAQCIHHAVEEFPTENGPADYALFVKGELLGLIEAKKVSVGAQNVLEQAKRYSRGAAQGLGNWHGYRVPFLYATNGEVVYFIDVRDEKNISRRISNFHTPYALAESFNKDRTNRPYLDRDPSLDFPRLRPYQKNAINAIEKALLHGKREMLVAMATGTGKTYVTVTQIYRLLTAKHVKRVLFLVDRRALAAQATREFASFNTPTGIKFNQEYEVYSQKFRKDDFADDEPFDPKVLPNSYLTEPKASNSFVYISTIQRMTVNLFGWSSAFEQDQSDPDYEEDADKLSIPNHAFDLIIADECHRGYTAKETAIWREVLDYFDAVKIGLTATPAAHSISLFKEVVFRYTTDEAILDGYLVDYEPVKISSGVLINGAFLEKGEHVGYIDTVTGKEVYDELEDEREFPAEKIEQDITIPDTNRKIIKELAKHAYEHEKETGRFPKILIFAANDLAHISHADQLVRICREEFGQGDDFVQKITGNPNVDRPLQKIREFRNRPNPKIVVTVDMLSTGVDIPSLEFIVFLRHVKSRILWVQMLGRGTRICPEINKSYFLIFDCFDGSLIDYFRDTTDFKFDPPAKEPIPISTVIENIYQNVDREYNIKVLVKRLRRIEKDMSGEAREKFLAYIPGGDIGRFATQLSQRLRDDFTETMKLLRNKAFQNLLINYARAKRTFIVGYEEIDTVTSSRFLTAEGEKPEDYLLAFSRFVRENPEHIEAISILLERPKEWRTDVLNDLRLKLHGNKYPEKRLQEAYKRIYNKSLADIISMVKHAARKEEPVLTAEERVEKALGRIMEGKKFNIEQLKWLEFIRNHLVSNLTIGLEDFNDVPVFEQRGGQGAAERVFGPQLQQLIQDLNYAMAA